MREDKLAIPILALRKVRQKNPLKIVHSYWQNTLDAYFDNSC
jgi:hypothetical protein